ncbi:MAG: thrombospondin type 3 repeat-containing protein, partial [Opitutales bacterium]|nr:thrombospondin type 3 repeat-containing protein [Opitutales bacterium]
MKHIPLYLFAFPLFISYAMALDENGNGLSDVWEQRFNASDLVLEDDDDGDRFTNLEECIAGTDPNDSTDHPQLFPTV